MRRKLVAANWKMNGSSAVNAQWIAEWRSAAPPCDAVVCAPYVYLAQVGAAEIGTDKLAVVEHRPAQVRAAKWEGRR